MVAKKYESDNDVETRDKVEIYCFDEGRVSVIKRWHTLRKDSTLEVVHHNAKNMDQLLNATSSN